MAASLSRPPTYQDATSFVSASSPNPRPNIASAFGGGFRGRHVLLLRVAKCPCLIDLAKGGDRGSGAGLKRPASGANRSGPAEAGGGGGGGKLFEGPPPPGKKRIFHRIGGVGFGSFTSLPGRTKIGLCPLYSVSDHFGRGVDWSLSAISDQTHRSKQRPYSINSSARCCICGDTSRPKAFAVLRLITS